MANVYYTKTFDVSPGTRVGSQTLEDQFLLVEQAFDSVQTLTPRLAVTNTFTALQTFGGGVTVVGGTYTGTHDFTGGNIVVTTKTAGDSTTAAASTAFVTGAVASEAAIRAAADSAETARALAAEALLAPKANPTFTGTVTVPTPTNPTDAVNKQYIDGISTNVGVNRAVTDYTATGGQTVFAATYTPPYLDVYVNGVKLQAADYTATNGTSVTLANGCTAGDAVTIITYTVISLTQMNIAGGTAYAIPYQTAPNYTAFVSAGTAGQVLLSGGPSAAPYWATYSQNGKSFFFGAM